LHWGLDVPHEFDAVTQISVVVPAVPVKFTVTLVVPPPEAMDEPDVVDQLYEVAPDTAEIEYGR
jgi:hypothetical protein